MAESTAPAAPVPAPTAPSAFPLLTALFALLAAHRPAFRQERPHQWVTGLVVGWLLVFERHTVTRVLVAEGVVGTDWSRYSRLLARPRVAYDRPTRCLLRQTLVLAMDGVVIPATARRCS